MRRTYSGFFIVFSLAFIFGLAGCQSERTVENPSERVDKAPGIIGLNNERTGESVVNQSEKVRDYMDDAAITTRIKAEIVSDPLLNITQIEVTTTNGMVKLSGTVNSQQEIDRAMEIARSLEDVKSVDNALVY